MNVVIGNVIIALGTAFVVLGLFGIFRFKSFYLKLLTGSKIDTIGMIAVLLGAVVRSGVTWFSAKVLLVLAIVLLINPIVSVTLAAGKMRADGPSRAAAEIRSDLTEEG